jgi:hypothetical protein
MRAMAEPITDYGAFKRFRIPIGDIRRLCEKADLPRPVRATRILRGEVSALFLLIFEDLEPLVLKAFVRPSGLAQMRVGSGVSRELRGSKVPTPQWLYSSVGDDRISYPHALIEYAPGTDADVIWPELDDTSKYRVMEACGQTMSVLHASGLTREGPAVAEWAADQCHQFDALVESLHQQRWLPSPVLRRAQENWRERSDALSTVDTSGFVHYDFQLHNLRLDPSTGRITALLDFDNATMAPSFTDARDLTVNIFLKEPDLSRAFWGVYGPISEHQREILRLHCLVRVLGVLSAYSGPAAGLSGSTIERLMTELPS